MEDLRSQWSEMYRTTLPNLAKKKDSAQRKWPVTLDHCFARIILDNAVGKTRPWADVIKAPAIKNMTEPQIKAALSMGQDIVDGKADLVELDESSLALRGKKSKIGGTKRKAEAEAEVEEEEGVDERPSAKKAKRSESGSSLELTDDATKREKSEQNKTHGNVTERDSAHDTDSISDNKATSKSKYRSTNTKREHISDLQTRIRSDKALSTYRQNVLILLTQVPRGKFTTYKALANGYTNTFGKDQGTVANARAVGSAMRNNPFAPAVPCHRVIAADLKIGGFGGEWGEEGKHAKEKIRLLREEGVRFDGKGKAVGTPFAGYKAVEG